MGPNGLGLATAVWFLGLFSIVELLRGQDETPDREPNWTWVRAP